MSAIEALCLVVFDVDVGQQVEAMHPAGALTAQEASDVAFHSFPVSSAAACQQPPAQSCTLRAAHTRLPYKRALLLLQDSMSMELRSKSSVKDSSFFFRIKRRGQQPPGAAQFLYG